MLPGLNWLTGQGQHAKRYTPQDSEEPESTGPAPPEAPRPASDPQPPLGFAQSLQGFADGLTQHAEGLTHHPSAFHSSGAHTERYDISERSDAEGATRTGSGESLQAQGPVAGVHATLVPSGWRQPHMVESMGQGGPCHASGMVQPGDLLLEVDGSDVRTLPLKKIQAKILGPPGTQVTLTLQRGKRNFPHKVTVARALRTDAPHKVVGTSRSTPAMTEIRQSPRDFKPTSPRTALVSQGNRNSGSDHPAGPRDSRDSARSRGYEGAEDSPPRPVGVPPLFGLKNLTGSGQNQTTQPREERDFAGQEKALSARADFWEEKYNQLKEQQNQGTSEETEDLLKLLQKEQAAKVHAENELASYLKNNDKVDDQIKASMERLQNQLEREQQEKAKLQRSLEGGSGNSSASEVAKLREQLQQSQDELKEVEAQEQSVRRHLEQKIKKLEQQLQSTDGSAPENLATSKDSHQRIFELEDQVRSLRSSLDKALSESKSLLDQSRDAPSEHVQLRQLQRELLHERAKYEDEATARAKERDSRVTLEAQFSQFKSEADSRESKLHSLIRRLEKDLESSNEKCKTLNLEQSDAVHKLMHEVEEKKRWQAERDSQLKKLSADWALECEQRMEADDRCKKLEQQLQELSTERRDTVRKLEHRIEQLEQDDATKESALIRTSRSLEVEGASAIRLERELDSWKERAKSAEHGNQQLESLLKRKQEELKISETQTAAEREQKNKYEVEIDNWRHQNTTLRDKLRETEDTLQGKLSDMTNKFDNEARERRSAELAVNELSGNLKHLTQHCKGLEERVADLTDQLKATESQRDRTAFDLDQVRSHMSSTQKELSVKIRERDDEIRVLKQQHGEIETNLGHQMREKHELERTVTDLKEEKRRADLLSKKLQDLEGFSSRESQARQQAQDDLKKAQRFAESVTEWDKALQEKVTKLESQRQQLESSLSTTQALKDNLESRLEESEGTLEKTSRLLSTTSRRAQELNEQLEQKTLSLMQERKNLEAVQQLYNNAQSDAKRKGEVIETQGAQLAELVSSVQQERERQALAVTNEEEAAREIEMLKRNLMRAEEIANEERSMRQDLEQEYERLKARSFNIDTKNGKRHTYVSDVSLFSLNDIHQLQQKLLEAQTERDSALFDCEQTKAKLNDLSMTVRTRNSGESDDKMIRMSQNVVIAKEALDEANQEISRLQKELDKIKRNSGPAPEGELAAAHNTIYELGLQISDLETENERLNSAVSDAAVFKQGEDQADTKVAMLQEQLERLMSLRTRTEETLTTRLEHTMQDYKQELDAPQPSPEPLKPQRKGW